MYGRYKLWKSVHYTIVMWMEQSRMQNERKKEKENKEQKKSTENLNIKSPSYYYIRNKI